MGLSRPVMGLLFLTLYKLVTHRVGSEIHTKHINELQGQNVEFLNAKPCGI